MMRRALPEPFALAASAAFVLAAAPAFAGDDWGGRGDYGWGGFTGYGHGGVHEGRLRYGSGWQDRVRRDGNAPYRAYNSWDGYRRHYGYGGYGWGWGHDSWASDCSYGCSGYGGYEGYGGYHADHGYRAAYRRYGGYWTRPSDRYYGGYGGYGDWGYGRGWRDYDREYVDEPCEPRTYGYHYGRTRC